MRPGSTDKQADNELELPALDGEDDAESPAKDEAYDLDDIAVRETADAFDDKTSEDAPHEELAAGGESERGWLIDAESVGDLDIGPVNVSLAGEGARVVGADDIEAEGAGALDDLVEGDEAYVADSGEEGPLADDEELREEDLPALDADEDGDVADDDLYDRSLIGEDLRWDDRAWTRDEARTPSAEDAGEDSGLLPLPSEDPTFSARDAAWRTLEATGRLMAAAYLPGASVVVALATVDRSKAQLVRIQPDGEARIIAEVEAPGRTEDEDCVVTFVRWDGGSLIVSGNFGVERYRPTL